MTQAGDRRVLVKPLVTGHVVKVGGDKVNYRTSFERSGGDAEGQSVALGDEYPKRCGGGRDER